MTVHTGLPPANPGKPVQEDVLNLSPLPLAVFVVDASGAIASWNKACEKLAGYTAADIRRKTLEEIIEFDAVSGARLSVADRVERDSSGQLRCADGRRLPVRVTIAPQSLEPEHTGTFSVIVIPRAGLVPPRYALIQDLPTADIIEGLPCVF